VGVIEDIHSGQFASDTVYLSSVGHYLKSVLRWLAEQAHKPYVFGAENDGKWDKAKNWDCSELIQGAVTQLRKVFTSTPSFVDGAHAQYEYMKLEGRPVKPFEGSFSLDLGFIWNKDAIGQRIGHVVCVWDQGLYSDVWWAIEARGKPYSEVTMWPVENYLSMFGNRWAGWWRLPEMTRYYDLLVSEGSHG
jgi:hypothetical protein